MSKKTSLAKKVNSILKDTSTNGIIDATTKALHPEITIQENNDVVVPGKLPDDFKLSLKQKALSDTMGIPLDSVIENQLYNTTQTTTTTTNEEEPTKKRGRPPKSSPHVSPKVSPRSRSNSGPPPPPPTPSVAKKIEEEQYIKSRKIENIERILIEIYDDPILCKRPLPKVGARSGLLEDCSIKQLDEFRNKLFELIGRDTQVNILSGIYYGGLGFSETIANTLYKTKVTDNEIVAKIGSLPPGTLAIAIKQYNDAEGGDCIERDLRLTAAYYSEYIPSHPLLNLVSDTWKALAAVAHKPALYGIVFGGGGVGNQPTNINVSSFASSYGKRRGGGGGGAV